MNISVPVRLCCGEEHYGAVCPDGKVMCQLCFERFDVDDLNVVSIDFEGQHEDVCKSCARKEEKREDRSRS